MSHLEQTAQQSLTRERPQDRHVAYVVEAGANARDRQVGGRHVGATGPGLALGSLADFRGPLIYIGGIRGRSDP